MIQVQLNKSHGDRIPLFETERLYTREFEQSDFDRLEEIRLHPEFYYRTLNKNTKTEAFLEDANKGKEIENGQRKYYRIAACLKNSDELIGQAYLGLFHFSILDIRAIGLGVFIAPKNQRKGFAKELFVSSINFAFEQYDQEIEIISMAHPDNVPSIKLHQVADFKYMQSGNLNSETNLPENDRKLFKLTREKWNKLKK